MTELTLEHKLLCDVAAVRAHLDKYSNIEQRALLGRVMDHLSAVVEAQRAAPAASNQEAGEDIRRKAQQHSDYWRAMLNERRRPLREHIEMAASQLQHLADDAAAQPASPLRGIDWQPMSTAPKDGTPVFLIIAGTKGLPWSDYWDLEEKLWTFYHQTQEYIDRQIEPTHWMPIPSFSAAPPEQPPAAPEVQFLLDRLEEYDPEDEDHVRDFHGHVAPAIARLRNAVTNTSDGMISVNRETDFQVSPIKSDGETKA